jgi:hypothetical protein
MKRIVRAGHADSLPKIAIVLNFQDEKDLLRAELLPYTRLGLS